jgi:hypothetical protein
MRTTSLVKAATAATLAVFMSVGALVAQTTQSLGSVRLPKSVTANGQPLAAGTYSVRLSSDTVTPAVGQAPESEKWVEFLQNGQVKGKELATVVGPGDVKQVAKGAPPASGSVKVEALKGEDYLRVWLNRGGTQYLIHFNVAK